MNRQRFIHKFLNVLVMVSMVLGPLSPVALASTYQVPSPIAPSEQATMWPTPERPEIEASSPFPDPASLALEHAMGDIVDMERLNGHGVAWLEPFNANPLSALNPSAPWSASPRRPDPLANINPSVYQPEIALATPSMNLPIPDSSLASQDGGSPQPTNLTTLANQDAPEEDVPTFDRSIEDAPAVDLETSPSRSKKAMAEKTTAPIPTESGPTTPKPADTPIIVQPITHPEKTSLARPAVLSDTTDSRSVMDTITHTVYLPLVLLNAGLGNNPPIADQIIVTPTEGGTLISSDGVLQLVVPSGAVTSPVTITYQLLPAQTVTGFVSIGPFFELIATDAAGNEVTQFQQNLTLSVQYGEVDNLDEAGLQLHYLDEAQAAWLPISPTVVDTQSNTLAVTLDHFTRFGVVGPVSHDGCTPPVGEDPSVPPSVPPEVSEDIHDAWYPAYDCPVSKPYVITTLGGVNYYVQEFPNGTPAGAIVDNPNLSQAFFLPDDVWNQYEPIAFELGGPLGNQPSAPKHFIDENGHNFREQEIWYFEYGFVSLNGGSAWEAHQYFPEFPEGEFTLEADPDPDSGKYRLILTTDFDPNPAAEGVTNPAPNDPSATIRLVIEDPDENIELISSVGSGKISDLTLESGYNYYPTQTLKIYVAGTRNGSDNLTGYSPCAHYDPDDNAKVYYSLNPPISRRFEHNCVGNSEPPDTTPPVIIHEPGSEDSKFGVWQNGKGWAIIAAEVTDNVGVAWVKVTVNGVEYPMTFHGGDTYVAFPPLQLGKNTYFISAEDTSGNPARHPETGEHEIWSDMASLYGFSTWMAYSDDPVNTGIGNFVYHYKDAEVPALGLDIVIERWFNHQSRYNGPFGVGWTFLYDMRLIIVDNLLFSGVQLRYADGRVVNFEADGSGGFTAPETVHDTLEKAGSEYVLTLKDQTVYRFNEDGRLVSLADKDGNTLTLNYSGEELTAIVDASGRALTFSYTDGHIIAINIPDYGTVEYNYQDDRLVSIIDTEGNQVSYAYDETTGCLQSITSPEGKPFLAQQTCDEDRRVIYQLGGTGYVNEFSYDDATKTTAVLDPFGNPTTHIYDDEYRVIENQDALGNSTTYTYNDDYLPLTVTDKNGNTTTYTYDDNGNTLTVTDALGYVTTYTYDANNNMRSRTDALSNTTTYEYDLEGHLILETDPLGGVTEYTYNSEGLLIRTIDPLGHTTETAYNALGLPVATTDALGNTTTMTYDAAGRLISETDPLNYTTTYQYNNLGQVEAVTDPEGNTSTYEYDGDQNLIRETNADGFSKTYTYDDNNRLVAETDWAGNVTTYVYDDLARKIAEIDPLGHQITYEYDSVSNLIVQTDKRGAKTTYTYDAHGNLLTATDALSNVTSYKYDALNRQVEVSLPCDCPSRVERTVYDALGRGIERIDALGNSTHFEYDAMGREVRRIDALGNETTRVYDLAGNLIEEIDALGNSTRYEYDPLNRQVAVTNRLGFTIRKEYDAAGRIVAEIDERGNRTEHSYDGNDRLLQTIGALGNSTSYTYDGRGNRLTITDALGRVTESTYDANSNVISLTNLRGYTTHFAYDAMNQRVSMTDALGGVTGYTYGPAGDLLTETDALGYTRQTTYDILGRTQTETDRNGNTTSYAYDAAGNLIRVTDALGGVTLYTYDANNNRLSETDPLGHSTHYVYDAFNREIKLHDALGGVTRSVYDALGRLIELIDANSNATQFTYDAEGQLIAVTDALGQTSYNVYDPTGNLIEETDRNGNTTSHTYDALNREIAITNALGHAGSVTFDAVGNVITRVNFRGYATQFAYDENNNLIRQINAPGGVTRYEYDALDRKISETDANGHTTRYTYDAVGNLLTVTLPEGQVSSYTYDGERNRLTSTNAMGFTTTYSYDALNRQVTETDPLGHTTTTEYDAIGHIIRTIDANGNGTHYAYDALGCLTVVTDALGYTTTYSYDAVGNRLAKTDANGHATTFVYDALNRLVSETNPIGSTWFYHYDPEGNLIEHVDANGQLIRYDFDAVHQLIAIRFADSSQNVSYTYDENGNLIRMEDPIGATTLVYDELDREVSKTDVYGYVTLKAYDPVGNRIALTYPDGNRVSYIYNGNDWLVTMTDPRQGQTQYAYQDDGQVSRIDHANKTWALMVYDDAGRLVRLFNGTEYHDEVVISYDYTLDKVGNRLQTIERYTQGQIRTNIETYIYNARYELLEAVEEYEGPPPYTVTTSYTYDPAGNRLSMTTNRDIGPGPQPDPETIIYTYDAANRLLSAGGMTFTYDASGNRLTKLTPTTPPSQSHLETYEYDEQNRLTLYTREQVQNGHVEQRVYSLYDGLGRRVNKGTQESSGVIKWTRYALDGLSYDQLAEYPQVGPPRVTELYRGVDNQLVSMDEIQGDGTGSQYWFAHDGLESVAATTKQNGQSSHEFFYDPYGQLIDENGHWEDSSSWTDPHNYYLLSGKEWDEESRLYYFGARFYDAQAGVWITPDPYHGEARVPLTLHPYFGLGHNPPNQADNANSPMSLHRYLYVQNNPLNRIDVNGYSVCGPYAKCRTEPDPLLKFIFGLSQGWEIKFSLWEYIGSTIKGPKDQLALPGFQKEVNLEFILGYSIQDTNDFSNVFSGELETCRALNVYAKLALEGTWPFPGATFGLANAKWGIGGSGGIQGSLKGCISNNIDVKGGLDFSSGYIAEASLALTAQAKVFIKGDANIFVANGSLEFGGKANFEYPLVTCKVEASIGIRRGYGGGGCDGLTTKINGSFDFYAEARAKTLFGGEWYEEKSWRVVEGEFPFEVPTLMGWIKKFRS